MNYRIHFSCISHPGSRRRINQDNFICDGRYMQAENDGTVFPIEGYVSANASAVFGVFDGMGGEECGEVASFIAAEAAASLRIGGDVIGDISAYCTRANGEICRYAAENGIGTMGTTAAMMVFAPDEIVLCNIGDSRIYRFSGGRLEQISQDHTAVGIYGRKPPLSQHLGIPPSELLIEPYLAAGRYNKNDIYLICSDGLTDMLNNEEIRELLCDKKFDGIAPRLLNRAIEKGGKDNISLILCRIERDMLGREGKKAKNMKEV